MYVILYDVNDTGWKLTCKTISSLNDAKKTVDELAKNPRYRNVRLLQDVKEDPYKELYHQLYNDFVIGKSQPREAVVEHQEVTIKD